MSGECKLEFTELHLVHLREQLQSAKSINEYITEQVAPIILENQGLKLYKDNEINRLRETFEAIINYIKNKKK